MDKEDIDLLDDKWLHRHDIHKLIFSHTCPHTAIEVRNNDILFAAFYKDTAEHSFYCRVHKLLRDMEWGKNVDHMTMLCYKVFHKTNLCQNTSWWLVQFDHKNILI